MKSAMRAVPANDKIVSINGDRHSKYFSGLTWSFTTEKGNIVASQYDFKAGEWQQFHQDPNSDIFIIPTANKSSDITIRSDELYEDREERIDAELERRKLDADDAFYAFAYFVRKPTTPAEHAKFAEDMKQLKDTMMPVVAQNGCALRYATNHLQKDKDIVMAAVKQDGLALRFASHELQMNMEIRLMAVN